MHRRRLTRALLGPLAGAVLLLQGLLVPMLDGLDAGRGPVIESKHDAATCPAGHDHAICVQVGANHVASSPEVRLQGPRVTSVDLEVEIRAELHSATPVLIHGPRGPPLA